MCEEDLALAVLVEYVRVRFFQGNLDIRVAPNRFVTLTFEPCFCLIWVALKTVTSFKASILITLPPGLCFSPEQEVGVGRCPQGFQCCFRYAEISSFIPSSVEISLCPS